MFFEHIARSISVSKMFKAHVMHLWLSHKARMMIEDDTLVEFRGNQNIVLWIDSYLYTPHFCRISHNFSRYRVCRDWTTLKINYSRGDSI